MDRAKYLNFITSDYEIKKMVGFRSTSSSPVGLEELKTNKIHYFDKIIGFINWPK